TIFTTAGLPIVRSGYRRSIAIGRSLVEYHFWRRPIAASRQPQTNARRPSEGCVVSCCRIPDEKRRPAALMSVNDGSDEGAAGESDPKDALACSSAGTGLTRCRYHGRDGMHRWVGLGVIADNLVTIARFTSGLAA